MPHGLVNGALLVVQAWLGPGDRPPAATIIEPWPYSASL
jgi:hypothetical protein